ncbi:hypothetical protein XELAEV_18015541mg [Xenopus laevis]|uniref:Uncharacterized protein n=1 Tax=Xenopus laevis TaxID=8355 RepID=A0A974DK11_XENLA|nr:hypothetical protein XELAEV_18015541mg [Xenopus laevis]
MEHVISTFPFASREHVVYHTDTAIRAKAIIMMAGRPVVFIIMSAVKAQRGIKYIYCSTMAVWLLYPPKHLTKSPC